MTYRPPDPPLKVLQIQVAEEMLRLSMPAVKQGAIASDVCRWATIWLDKRWKL